MAVKMVLLIKYIVDNADKQAYYGSFELYFYFIFLMSKTLKDQNLSSKPIIRPKTKP